MYVKIEDTIPEEEEEDVLDTLIHNRCNQYTIMHSIDTYII